MELYQKLTQYLSSYSEYFEDGEFKKWVVIEKIKQYDKKLIKVLMNIPEIKENFFVEIEGTWIFKEDNFIWFLEQKKYLKNNYTKYLNQIGLNFDNKYLKYNKDVVLNWPYKDCVLEGGQTKDDQNLDEIFFNEILAQDEISKLTEPKVFTNGKRIDADGERTLDKFNRNEQGLITDNMIINGNNLLTLYSLEREFAGKVKLIYIDPPYNTGNDTFCYNDNFNHSSWLTFMKNRLEVARRLLRDDGMIFVQCDDNEQAYLKVLMDDIFGIKNFIANLTNIVKPEGRNYGNVARASEYILMYQKTELVEFNEIESHNDFTFLTNLVVTI